MKTLIFLVFNLIVLMPLYAQYKNGNAEYVDEVHLKNGSVYRGQLVEQVEDHLVLKSASGTMIKFNMKQVRRVNQRLIGLLDESGNLLAEVPYKAKNKYEFKEKGFYNAFYGALNGAQALEGNTVGFELMNTFGYQFHRWIGAGLSLGYNNFEPDNIDGKIIFTSAEVRGYVARKNRSPYYSMNIGYGYPLRDTQQNLDDTKGGWRIHPALGMRLGGSSDANFLFDFGYVLQRATFINDFTVWQPETLTEKKLYKRFTFRVGFVF